MIIILEGPDGAGKSTLAKNLEDQLYNDGGEDGASVTLLHNGPPQPFDTEPPFVAYLNQIAGWAAIHGKYDNRHLIVDRLHIGEKVYGPIFRGESQLTENEVYAIERYLDAIGAIKIFVAADLETLTARIKERGDDMVKEGQIEEVARQYNAEMMKLKNWVVWTPKHSLLAGFKHHPNGF